jgi:arabinofuranosyltransferase
VITIPRGTRSVARGLLASLPAVVLLTMGYRHRWVTDDAFIDFRVVTHLVAGDGPVFNLGERVEAYSNPLWLGLLAVWSALGGRLETGAVVLGLALSVGSIALAQLAATKLLPGRETPEERQPLLPLGAAVVAALPVFWDFATSGLETSLSFFWLAASSWLLARRGSPKTLFGSAVVLGLGPLIRPDLTIFSVVFVSAFLIQSTLPARSFRARLGRALPLGASCVALPAAYQAFRMGYFAGVVPNPALAKEAGLPFYERGFAYAWDLLGCYVLPLPLCILAGFWAVAVRCAFRRRDWVLLLAILAPVIGAILHTAYVVRVGGDFMHGRLLLPALFAFMLPVAAVRFPSIGSPHHAAPAQWAPWIAGAVIVSWTCVCARVFRFHELDVPWGIVDERGFYVDQTGIENPTRLDDYDSAQGIRETLAELAASPRMLVLDDEPRCDLVQVTRDSVLRYCTASSRDPVRLPLRATLDSRVQGMLAHAKVGAIGYALGTRANVVDRRGLGDALASRLRLRRRGRAGHEKMLGDAWILARATDPPRTRAERPAVVAAREALRCGAAAELREATEAPLDVSRFVSNLRVALRLHALRIADDPSEARDELCREVR